MVTYTEGSLYSLGEWLDAQRNRQLLAAASFFCGEFETVHDWLRDRAQPISHAAVAEVGAGMVDAHDVVTETATVDQTDAMTDTTRQRYESYTALSRQ